MAPSLAQNEQLQRIPLVMASASNENWIAPQWQLPLNGCIVMFHDPSVFPRYYCLVKTIAMLISYYCYLDASTLVPCIGPSNTKQVLHQVDIFLLTTQLSDLTLKTSHIFISEL